MAQIISFSAVLNERRAAAEAAARAAVQEERKGKELADKFSEVVDHYAEGDLLKAAVAAVQFRKIEEKQKQEESRPMPAYCEPRNEVKGCKYEANRGKSRAELAKLMRADIKAAVARGLLPKGLKVSVRSDRLSIDIKVTAIPDGQRLYNPEWVLATNNFSDFASRWAVPGGEYAPEVAAWVETLKGIHGAYNRDNSDSMTDYFDVNFYGHVEIYWELADARREAEKRNLETREYNVYRCPECDRAWTDHEARAGAVVECECGAWVDPTRRGKETIIRD